MRAGEVDHDHDHDQDDPNSTDSILSRLSSLRSYRPPRDNFDADDSDFDFFDRNINPQEEMIEEIPPVAPVNVMAQELHQVPPVASEHHVREAAGLQSTRETANIRGENMVLGSSSDRPESHVCENKRVNAPSHQDRYLHHPHYPVRYEYVFRSGSEPLVIYQGNNLFNQPIGGMVNRSDFDQVIQQQYHAAPRPGLNRNLLSFDISLQNSNQQSYYRGRGGRGRGGRGRGRD